MILEQQFGAVHLSVNLEAETCRLVVVDPRAGMRQPVLHSLDEIISTHQSMRALAAFDPVAADFARALEFAGTQIKAQREDDHA